MRIKDDTIASILNFKDRPLESLGQLLSIGMVCTSMIGFFVALIMFTVEGGFSNQISAVKGDLI